MTLHPLPLAHGTIEIDSISIPERLRKDDPTARAHIDEVLLPSIAEVGLIQPIILADDEKTLIAGWCRLQACKALGYTQICYNTQREMPESDKLFMELEENNKRLDMSWQEKVLAIEKIYHAKHRERIKNRESWGRRQAGALLGVSSGHLNDMLKVAAEIHAGNERILSAKTLREANNTLYEKVEDSLAKELASRSAGIPAGATISKRNLSMGPSIATLFPESTDSLSEMVASAQASSTFQELSIPLSSQLHNMDSREFFKKCEKEVFDLIYTDIPYGIDVNDKLEGIEGVERVAEEHDVDYNLELMPDFLKGAYKVLKNNSFLLFWYDISHHEKLVTLAEKFNFKVQGYPLHWIKMHPCRNKSPQNKWTKCVEYVFVARKGTPTFKDTKYTPNHFACEGLSEKRQQANPFAKPFAFSQWALSRFVIPGSSVLDPFMGDGSLLRASVRLGLVPYGVEINDKCFHRAVVSIQETYRDMTNGKVVFT